MTSPKLFFKESTWGWTKACDITLCFIDKDETHWAISKVSAVILTCADISQYWQNLRKTHYLVDLRTI